MYKQLLLIGGLTGTLVGETPTMFSWSSITKESESIASPDINQAIIELQAHFYLLTRKHTCLQHVEKDKEEIRKILANFAGIMQCFFTIAQNPENKEMVRANIVGIIGYLFNAGRVIMQGNDKRDALIAKRHLSPYVWCTFVTKK